MMTIFIGNERQKKLAEYLQKQKASTAHALADQFGVTERTIRSDVKALKKIFPILVKQGKANGGIYWESEELYEFR